MLGIVIAPGVDSSAQAQNACLYWALERLKELFQVVYLLLHPFEGDSLPFYAAYEEDEYDPDGMAHEIPAVETCYSGVSPYGSAGSGTMT